MTMSERRLCDGDDFAGRLLREGHSDAPLPGAAAKIATGLALGSIAQVSAASAAASSVNVLAGAAAGGKTAVSALATFSLVKSFGVGLLAGTVSLGLASAVSELASPSAGQSAKADSAQSRSAAATPMDRTEKDEGQYTTGTEPQVEVPPETIASPRSATTPRWTTGERSKQPTRQRPLQPGEEAPTAAVGALPADAVPRPISDPALTVTEEVTIVDRIRAALSGGRPAEALRLLDEHQSRMKTLWVEAQVLRVEALARAGSLQAARALGEQFIRTYPGTAHAARVREILQE
jgi:TolA-binding protein